MPAEPASAGRRGQSGGYVPGASASISAFAPRPLIVVASIAGRLSGCSSPEVAAVALRAVLKRLAVVRRMEMAADIDRVNVDSAVRSAPTIDVAIRAGRLSGRSSREVAAVALRAVLKRPAKVRRVEIAAEIDRVRAHSAGRFVPMSRVALRAGRLSDGTSLEAVAVARSAMQERLAVARRMKMTAEIHVVTRSGGNAGSVLACADRIVRIPAARRRKGVENACDNGEKRFSVHIRLQHAHHA
jgi:hypothetical protein